MGGTATLVLAADDPLQDVNYPPTYRDSTPPPRIATKPTQPKPTQQ